MNYKKNLELISKKNIKNSILKYSNITLFDQREKVYKSIKKVNKKTPKLFKSIKFFGKKTEETKENILNLFNKTMSSFYSLDKSSNVLPLLDYFENDKQNKNNSTHKFKAIKKKLNLNIEIQNYLNINDNYSKTANNFYITESSLMKPGKKQKIKKLSFLLNKEKYNKDDLSIDTLLLIQTFRNNNEKNKLKISGYLENKSQTYRKNYSYNKNESNKNNFENKIEENEGKNLIDNKISKFNSNRQPNVKDFIKKMQELKINSYTAKTKKERAIRLEEGYFNQIEFYQDTIHSLHSAQKLLDVQFSNKIADYTRFVMSKRERELVKSSKLIQEIINHRKDIEHIKNKINKIELEKSNILKWIFFMIQMKEKRLVLPNHYKTILEKVKVKRLSRRQPTRKDDKKEKNKAKIKRKPSFFGIDNNSLSHNRDSHNELNNIKERKNSDNDNTQTSRKEENDRILNYKHFLIFQTPEEFQERLNNFEKENITLLTYYNELYHQLFEYKNELNSLKKYEIINESRNLIIKEKEKELKDIKNLIEEKIKLISDFKKKEKHLEIEFKRGRNKSNENKIKKNIIGEIKDANIKIKEDKTNLNENKNTLLYRKINNIFEICKIIGSKLKFAYNILNLVNKKIYTKEKEMTLMLEFIEQTVDYLINKFNSYMGKNEEIQELIKKVKLDIEKEHKLEKARLQMMIDLQKITKLKEKVQKRSNKIYFLPTKKIDLSNFKIKTERKIEDKNLSKIPDIEDYLYNENNLDNK